VTTRTGAIIQHAGHQLDDNFPIDGSIIGSAHDELVMKEGKPWSDTIVPGGHKILYLSSAKTIASHFVASCNNPDE
jgi:hypothetical protein